MPSRQPSVKGRGAEILVGVPRALEVKSESPPAPEPEPKQPESSERQARADQQADQAAAAEPSPADQPEPLDEATLRAALYEEAQTGEPSPAGEDAAWLREASWPPTPEMEMALIDHDRALRGSPQLSNLIQRHATEETMEAAKASDEAAEATSEESETDWSSAADTLDIQSPETVSEPLELPSQSLTEEEQKALEATASDRILKLDRAIDEVYQQVLNELGDNESLATACYNDLLRARDIVLRRDLSRLAQAEYYVEQARARLRRSTTSAVGARKNAWWIFAWGLMWGMIYLALVILLGSAWARDWIAALNLTSSFVDPQILLSAMVWGGIGGVVAIWYSLFKHIALRDFDGHYNISYLGKPFFGLILGATVYMLIRLVVAMLGVAPYSLANETTATVTPSVAPWIIYVLAWVCGFKENRIFGVVDYVMKRVFPEKESTPSTPLLP